MTLRRIVVAGLFAGLLAGVAGCFNPFSPRIAPTTGIYIPPPNPNSAQNVIRLFEWCWNNRDITTYQQIFTADFRFIFALGDSAGNLFRDDPVTREMELNIARNLFVGGGSASPASSIVLNLAPTLRALPDSRVGKDPKWHNEIVSTVDLTIKTESGAEYHIEGNARFFVVRGDSAKIPQELGFKSDSTRWYIEQWNDETLQGAGATAPGPVAGESQAVRPGAALTRLALGRGVRSTGLAPLPQELTWGKLYALYAD